jgi:hypothetical protein
VADAHDARKLKELWQMSNIRNRMIKGSVEAAMFYRLRDIIQRRFQSNSHIYEDAIACLNNRDITSLINLYTRHQRFYSDLKEDGVIFTATIIMTLKSSTIQNYKFHGTTYRGTSMTDFDLDIYRWVWKRPNSVLEINTFTSTTTDEKVAEVFAETDDPNKYSVLFTHDFPVDCDTAINIRFLSKHADEAEILLLPFTLFKVTNISFEKASRKCNIHLVHVSL